MFYLFMYNLSIDVVTICITIIKTIICCSIIYVIICLVSKSGTSWDLNSICSLLVKLEVL